MKMVGLYLKGRIAVIFLILFMFAVEFGVFFLYSVDAAPVIYSMEVFSVILGFALLFDFVRFRKVHQNLQHQLKEKDTYDCVFHESWNVVEQEYQQLIEKLISEKYEMNEKYTAAMNELRDYYATWAHQIKTPISAIDLLLQMQEETGKINYRELKNELFQIDFYVDAVMHYLRLEDSSSDYTFAECSVDTVVRKAVKKFASPFIAKKISVDLYGLDVSIKMDEKWLGFMVEQLLSNAIKYTSEGGKISVYMEENKETFGKQLVIEDNGIGIASADLPRIFERGYTGYNGRMNQKSSGIGLYLCKKAANQLGITIKITSQIGQGTKVVLDFTQKHRDHE